MHTVAEVAAAMVTMLASLNLLDEGEKVEIYMKDGQYYWEYLRNEGMLQ